jgi:hypothetical protein
MPLGSSDGEALGLSEGRTDGSSDGKTLGSSDGSTDGSSDDKTLGSSDEKTEGSSELGLESVGFNDGEEMGSVDAVLVDARMIMSSMDSVLDHTVTSSNSPIYGTMSLYILRVAFEEFPKPPKLILPYVTKKTWLSGELGIIASKPALSPSIYN